MFSVGLHEGRQGILWLCSALHLGPGPPRCTCGEVWTTRLPWSAHQGLGNWETSDNFDPLLLSRHCGRCLELWQMSGWIISNKQYRQLELIWYLQKYIYSINYQSVSQSLYPSSISPSNMLLLVILGREDNWVVHMYIWVMDWIFTNNYF